MKKLLPIFAILPFLFGSCENDPYADFYVSDYSPEPFQEVYFYNTSNDFKDFEWDFGDGTYSRNLNPSHVYSQPGLYRVTLTVYGNRGEVDLVFQEIDVYTPTTLEITVLEYYDEYPVANASVILYTSYYDWDHQINALTDGNGNVLEGFTNSEGVVSFTGLDPFSYWIDAWHEYYNNYLLAADDENFIKTLPLERNTINTFVAYVDYTASASQKDGRKVMRLKSTSEKRTYPKETKKNKELVK